LLRFVLKLWNIPSPFSTEFKAWSDNVFGQYRLTNRVFPSFCLFLCLSAFLSVRHPPTRLFVCPSFTHRLHLSWTIIKVSISFFKKIKINEIISCRSPLMSWLKGTVEARARNVTTMKKMDGLKNQAIPTADRLNFELI